MSGFEVSSELTQTLWENLVSQSSILLLKGPFSPPSCVYSRVESRGEQESVHSTLVLGAEGLASCCPSPLASADWLTVIHIAWSLGVPSILTASAPRL